MIEVGKTHVPRTPMPTRTACEKRGPAFLDFDHVAMSTVEDYAFWTAIAIDRHRNEDNDRCHRMTARQLRAAKAFLAWCNQYLDTPVPETAGGKSFVPGRAV